MRFMAGTPRPSPTARRPSCGSAVPDEVAVRRQAPRPACSAASSSTRRTGSVGSAKIAVPDLDGDRADREEVEHVGELGHAADRDDRDRHRLGRLVHDPQRDRLDRRPAQPAVDVAEQRPAAGRAPTAIPDSVLIAVSASAPASAMARAIGPDVGDVRRQLDQQRQVGRAADRGGDLAGGVRHRSRTGARRVPTLGHEMFSSMPAMPGTPSSRRVDLDVVADRLAGDVDDDRHLPAGPRRGVLLDDRVDAGVLEADRVEHPARRLGHARRRIADPRLERRALAADRAEPVDVDDVAVLDAVAERARGDEDRVGQDEAAAEVDRQVDVVSGRACWRGLTRRCADGRRRSPRRRERGRAGAIAGRTRRVVGVRLAPRRSAASP